MPRLSRKLRAAVAPVAGSRKNVLHYQNFSLVQNARRRFPIFTAANIDGSLFKSLSREDNWQLDPRIDENHQWGPSLYSAEKSDFDRGHMAKREDVQWGHTEEEARRGALSTFFYTNAVPQVAKLNQQLWRSLEDYILKTEAVNNGKKIALFTGPVLSDRDPVFVTEVDGQRIHIPTLFWKVIYFTKSDGRLYRVGFLMGQEELLAKQGLVEAPKKSRSIFVSEEERLFMEFKHADIYQVNISTIRKLTKLIFTAAREPYKDKRPVNLIRKEVQSRSLFGDGGPSFEIEGLTL
ncbi:MAG: DNA/RNA non-specific endonuclease [Lewinellaceae bacterium]|nr:DNA/RNA non-specific endonuclease [Lewinellaceae bacterium]MCB9289939.1 DNA/RNA non-specific endonuclease [Lewinellaceae bacterium]